MGAVALALLVGAATLPAAGELVLAAAGLTTVAAAALAAGLWRRRAVAVPWSLLALGVAAALSFHEGGDSARSPLFAAGLLGVGELAYWSLETRIARPATHGLVARRVALLSGLVAGTVALGAILVSVGSIDPGGGLLLEAAGVAAAVLLVAAVLALSRRAA